MTGCGAISHLRKPSGKKPNGQLGHRGGTLRLVGTPDVLIEHRPAVCMPCQTPLAEAPEASVVGRERRQACELPPVHLQVTDHQALHVRCSGCQQVSVGTFSTAVPSRALYGPELRAVAVYLVEEQLVPLGQVQQLLVHLFGAQLGRGMLVS